MKKIVTNSFEETQKLGFDFAKTLHGGDVVCLYGDLGSGKTTFAQGFAQGLGITQKIISPTFIVIRSYQVDHEKVKNFHHVDLYRIESEHDIEGLGLIELMQDKENIVVIEWPEKIENMLPQNRKDILFKYIAEEAREIIFE